MLLSLHTRESNPVTIICFLKFEISTIIIFPREHYAFI